MSDARLRGKHMDRVERVAQAMCKADGEDPTTFSAQTWRVEPEAVLNLKNGSLIGRTARGKRGYS